jgi:hypothetical protein
MRKRHSGILEKENSRIYLNSVGFWRENKEICRLENKQARNNAEMRKRRVIIKIPIQRNI